MSSDAHGSIMTKSELIEIISAKQKHLPAKDVELAVKQLLAAFSPPTAGTQSENRRGRRACRQTCAALQAGQRPARTRERRRGSADPRLARKFTGRPRARVRITSADMGFGAGGAGAGHSCRPLRL